MSLSSARSSLGGGQRLFIASLGNPAPKYHKTRHSAGHILLCALASHLDAGSFTLSPTLSSGSVTNAYTPATGTRLTLWQSPTLMNMSGPTLVRAYRSWLAREGFSSPVATVGNSGASNAAVRRSKSIVVHDELQAPLGKLHVRKGGRELSHRGHNGLKSVVASLEKEGMLKLTEGGGKG